MQTAVCRALEKQRELQDPEALRAWFYHILVNVCMDALRKRKRVTLIPPEALDAGSYEDPLPSDGTLAQRVDALPPEVGTIIKLRFYEEHVSRRRSAQVTSCNLSTVKTRLVRGTEKAAGIYGKRGMNMNEFKQAREDYESTPIPEELDRPGPGGHPPGPLSRPRQAARLPLGHRRGGRLSGDGGRPERVPHLRGGGGGRAGAGRTVPGADGPEL